MIAVEKSVADTPFLDDSDDFIQSHVDSHLPLSKEVIEEQREEIDEQARFLSSDPEKKTGNNNYIVTGVVLPSPCINY